MRANGRDRRLIARCANVVFPLAVSRRGEGRGRLQAFSLHAVDLLFHDIILLCTLLLLLLSICSPRG